VLLNVEILFTLWAEFIIPLPDTHKNLQLNEEPSDERTQELT